MIWRSWFLSPSIFISLIQYWWIEHVLLEHLILSAIPDQFQLLQRAGSRWKLEHFQYPIGFGDKAGEICPRRPQGNNQLYTCRDIPNLGPIHRNRDPENSESKKQFEAYLDVLKGVSWKVCDSLVGGNHIGPGQISMIPTTDCQVGFQVRILSS